MRKEQLSLLNKYLDLFEFKTFTDTKGNEFVLYRSIDTRQFADIDVDDRTAFEAVQNHVHIFDNIRQSEKEAVTALMKRLGELMIDILSFEYPRKHFVVFVTVGDGAIIRFHQKWKDESWYYDVECEYEDSEIIMFEN